MGAIVRSSNHILKDLDRFKLQHSIRRFLENIINKGFSDSETQAGRVVKMQNVRRKENDLPLIRYVRRLVKGRSQG